MSCHSFYFRYLSYFFFLVEHLEQPSTFSKWLIQGVYSFCQRMWDRNQARPLTSCWGFTRGWEQEAAASLSQPFHSPPVSSKEMLSQWLITAEHIWPSGLQEDFLLSCEWRVLFWSDLLLDPDTNVTWHLSRELSLCLVTCCLGKLTLAVMTSVMHENSVEPPQ